MDDLESKLGGFRLEALDLELAVLGFVEGRVSQILSRAETPKAFSCKKVSGSNNHAGGVATAYIACRSRRIFPDAWPTGYTALLARCLPYMNHIQPEQASFLLQFSLPAVKNEHRTTRAVIEAIPADRADYRPDPASRSAMELAWHIVAAEHRFYSGIASGEFDFTPIHRPETVRSPVEIGEWYGDSFAKNFERLAALNGEQLSKLLDFRGMFQLPAVAYFDFSLRHSIHHRGQLSAYLRAMGGKVPAIYGESYDSAEAKKAVQAGTA